MGFPAKSVCKQNRFFDIAKSVPPDFAPKSVFRAKTKMTHFASKNGQNIHLHAISFFACNLIDHHRFWMQMNSFCMQLKLSFRSCTQLILHSDVACKLISFCMQMRLKFRCCMQPLVLDPIWMQNETTRPFCMHFGFEQNDLHARSEPQIDLHAKQNCCMQDRNLKLNCMQNEMKNFILHAIQFEVPILHAIRSAQI